MQTNRRSFLTRSSLGLAALASPVWISTAFSAPEDDKAQPRLKTLKAAWERAKTGGRPLLIFIVPEKREQAYISGKAWGQFLNYGATEHMALLPLAELTCASLKEIDAILGSELKAAEQSLPLLEPSALLIESSTCALRVVGLAPKELVVYRVSPDYQTKKELSAKRIDARITRTGQVLRQLLWPDDDTLARRLHEEQQALQVDTDELADDALVELAPATLLARVRRYPERLELALKLLAARTSKQMMDPIDGTYWGNSMGCGTSVEGHPELGPLIACGMGSVGHRSRRFLILYNTDSQF